MLIPEHIKQVILENIATLTKCDLSCQGLRDEHVDELVALLKKNAHFKELKLYRNNLSSEGVKKLVQNLPGNISTIDLSYNNLTDDCIDCLLAKESLNTYILTMNQFTSRCVPTILACHRRLNINIYHNDGIADIDYIKIEQKFGTSSAFFLPTLTNTATTTRAVIRTGLIKKQPGLPIDHETGNSNDANNYNQTLVCS